MAYHPSSIVKKKAELNEEPIPVVYIPRKPHPNGLLLYQAMSFIKHPTKSNSVLPFILDTLPHLQVGDINACQTVEMIISR